MTSFYYYDQNPSWVSFLLQIWAFVIETSLGLSNLNLKGKTNRTLVVVIKWRHRSNGLFYQYCVVYKFACDRTRNLTSVSNVCEAAPISLFWAPNRLEFRISFHPDWQIDNGYFNWPIMARTRILVHMQGRRTRISALLRRRTWPEFSFVCGAG